MLRKRSAKKNLWKSVMVFVFLSSLLILGRNRPAHATNPLYPDLKTLPPRDLRFDRTDVSADSSGDMHNVLRFSNTVYNVGEGKMEMWGSINPVTKNGIAYQRVYDTNGTFTDYQVGIFYYHLQHDHYHFEDWGQYQLWTKAEYDHYISTGENEAGFTNAGVKTTSCVLDEEFITTLVNTPSLSVYPYTGCVPNAQNKLVEGLSVGWGDTYDYYRYEQWIDLGQETLTDGDYILRTVSDPLNKMYESAGKADAIRESIADNEAITPFTISGGQIVDSLPPSGTVSINNVEPSTLLPNVTVRVIGRDDVSGVDQVMLSNDGVTWATYDYTGVQSVAQAISWNLADPAYGGSSQIGMKTVYVRFKDNTGKLSANEIDTIVLGAIPATSDYSNDVMADNPVSYWRLSEELGTAAYDNQGANHGVYTNAPTLGITGLISTDSSNKAIAVDGINDFVKVNDSGSLALGSRVTVEAWIIPTSIPTSGNFVSIVTKPESYSLQFNGPSLEFTIIQGNLKNRLQAPAGTLSAGQKYHIVGTYDGTNQRLYVNGVQVVSRALTGGITINSYALYVGAWNESTTEFFAGTIDEVAIYGSALSSARIVSHYDVGTGINASAPDTQIDSHPEILSNSSNADFTFSSADEAVTFECSLDNAAFSTCASPKNLTDLPDGSHNFRVRAKNSSDLLDATPASFTWTIDTALPTVISFVRRTPSVQAANANTLVFRATFSEPVTDVDAADFSVNGNTTATVTGITLVITSIYDVTISGGDLADFNGVVGLNFNSPTITDLIGNSFVNAEPVTDETYLVDNLAPTIISFVRQTPSASTTSADTLVFRATFSETVTGVGTADFAVNGTSAAVVSGVVLISADVYDATVSGGNLASFNGVVGLNFNSPVITDLAGNPFVNAEPSTDQTYTVDNDDDNIAPTVTVNKAGAQADPANKSPIEFSVVFSETVIGFSASDVSISGIAGTPVVDITGTGPVYTVSVSGMVSGEIVSASVPARVVQDAAGNDNEASTSLDNSVAFDASAKDITAFNFTSPFATGIIAGSNITVTVPAGTDVTALVANFTTTGMSVMVGEILQTSGVTANNFTSLLVYTVAAVDSSTKDYTVTINFNSDGGGSSSTFNDVPAAYWAYSWIERLYNAGITGGCSTSPLNYCPDGTVTRAQMAMFILRGIHGKDYMPPAATGAVFADVPPGTFADAWIEQLALEGITSGCGAGNFCPENSVTRAEMAIFLLRGEYGNTFIPPVSTGTVFGDVSVDTFAADWIEQLAAEGVTSGCGGGNYCPDGLVTRAEMAAFLVRIFDLP